jgi:glutaminyl-peptide cyclotransferase
MSVSRCCSRLYFRVLCLAAVGICTILCAAACESFMHVPEPLPVYTYEIVNTFPHDPQAFTEGLAFDNGMLYEGTGLYGESSVRKVDLETGRILQIYRLPNEYYGEGITVFKDTVVQLTWQSNRGFVYKKDGLSLLREFHYSTEGWGITHDANRIMMSDGTSALYLLNPETKERSGRIEVQEDGIPIDMINELEYVDGQIFANIWKSDRIARIDPESGKVRGWIDLTGLLDRHKFGNAPDVLNGIAYDEESGRLFVTGKLWPLLFEIRVFPMPMHLQRPYALNPSTSSIGSICS